MRLTCPNCDAQYEVPDDVIPEGGRDVQCSNCGHTWFEVPGQGAVALEKPPQAAEEEPPALQRDPDASGAAPDRDEEAPQTVPGQPPQPPRRSVSPEVASVLQQERQTSQALRQGDSMESQDDLPLSETPARGRPAPERGGSALQRLPDVDEINSSLGPAEPTPAPPMPEPEAAEVAAQRYRRGFRLGFGLVTLAAALAAGAYMMAPEIAEAVPAVRPALVSYVDAVDTARLWLDLTLQNLLVRMGDGAEAANAG